MNGLGQLIRRDCKLFFKDKGLFFSSLISPLILLVLYATFLGRIYRDSFTSALPEGLSFNPALLDATVAGQLISSLLAVCCVTVAVCANLPYYITSPIVMKLLGDRLPIQNLTVMVQKEAADRLAAARRLSDLLAVQRGILDNISDSVVIFSPNLKLKSYNVAFLRLWGLGAAELDASPYLRELLDLLKPKLPELEDWNTFREDMLKHITSCTPFTLKLRSKQRIMVTPVILADTSLMITYHKE